jgi:hypothetical protein
VCKAYTCWVLWPPVCCTHAHMPGRTHCAFSGMPCHWHAKTTFACCGSLFAGTADTLFGLKVHKLVGVCLLCGCHPCCTSSVPLHLICQCASGLMHTARVSHPLFVTWRLLVVPCHAVALFRSRSESLRVLSRSKRHCLCSPALHLRGPVALSVNQRVSVARVGCGMLWPAAQAVPQV